MRSIEVATVDVWNRRLEHIPFIYIEHTHGAYHVRGQAECLLGHKFGPVGTRAEGIYAGWRWDGSTLEAENDRYGFYPLFYFAEQHRICLSPVIPRLLAEGADRAIDDAAVAVFLRLGFFIQEDTPFRSIRCLPPDATFEWTAGRLKVEGRRCIRRATAMSREDALDGYIELFRQAISRRPPASDRFMLPLSGGRDSRHIFLELCERRWYPKQCVTVDMCHETDADVAARLTQIEGVPLHYVPRTAPKIEAELRKNLETSFCSDEHTWSLNLADYLSEVCECSYDGIAGDVLSASRFMSADRQDWFESGQFGRLAKELMIWTDRFVSTMLSPELRVRWSSELATSRIEEELRRYADAANPVPAFFFWNRTRREIALYSYGLLRNTRNVYAPFLDCELYDHVASLPVTMLLDRKFHDDAIRRAYPKAATIPFASTRGEFATASGSGRFAGKALTSMIQADHKTWIRTGHYGLWLLRSVLLKSRRREAAWLASNCLYMIQLEQASTDGLFV